MACSSGDAATAPEASELTDAALAQASSQADELVDTFNTDHRSTELEPELTWTLTVGASGEPLFRFSLVLALEDDLDPADFPSDQIADLMAEARRRIEASLVDEADWFVLLNARDAVEA